MAAITRKLYNRYPFIWPSPNGTPYAERADGSPSYSFGSDSRCERKIIIPWATYPAARGGPTMAVWQAAVDFLGYSTIELYAPGSDFKYIHRSIPHPLPGMRPERLIKPGGFSGQNYLYASEITRVEGDRTQGNKQTLDSQTAALPGLGLGLSPARIFEIAALDGANENQDGSGIGQFVDAIMSVVYTAPKYNIMTDAQLWNANGTVPASAGLSAYDECSLLRYVEIDIQPSGKYQIFKGFSTVHFTGNVARDFPTAAELALHPELFPGVRPPILVNDIPVMLNEGELNITWKQIPAEGVPWKAIEQTVGKTNNAVFGVSGYPGTLNASYQKGILLCLFPKFKLYRMINGLFCYDIMYRFKIYPYGANSFFRVNLYPVPYPQRNTDSRPGIKGSIASISDPAAPADVVVTSNAHGLITGDNVSLIQGIVGFGGGTGTGASIGSWQITFIDLNSFSLNNTRGVRPDGSDTVTHWIICMGFYPTSRSGLANSDGTTTDPIFPYADYNRLFRPE